MTYNPLALTAHHQLHSTLTRVSYSQPNKAALPIFVRSKVAGSTQPQDWQAFQCTQERQEIQQRQPRNQSIIDSVDKDWKSAKISRPKGLSRLTDVLTSSHRCQPIQHRAHSHHHDCRRQDLLDVFYLQRLLHCHLVLV